MRAAVKCRKHLVSLPRRLMVAHVQIPTTTIATKITEIQIHWIRGLGSPTDTGNTKTSLLAEMLQSVAFMFH